MPPFLTACAIAAWLVAVQAAGAARQPAPPALQFETLDSRPADEPRLRRLDRDRLRTIVQLVGLEDPGPPIRVMLAPEDSELARATSSWIAGFAHGATGTVVLFPSRSLRYPHDSLEAVLRHEVAHILIVRAADGRAVPRWFNEGLAVVAERAWHFEDRWQLAWALVSADQVRMDEVNDLFQAGSSGAGRGIRARQRVRAAHHRNSGVRRARTDPRRRGERRIVRRGIRAGDRPLARRRRTQFSRGADVVDTAASPPDQPLRPLDDRHAAGSVCHLRQTPSQRRAAQEMGRGRREPDADARTPPRDWVH